jgi:hypothetical protein
MFHGYTSTLIRRAGKYVTVRRGNYFLDAGYWMLVTGCWLLDTGYWMLDAGYRSEESNEVSIEKIIHYSLLIINYLRSSLLHIARISGVLLK